MEEFRLFLCVPLAVACNTVLQKISPLPNSTNSLRWNVEGKKTKFDSINFASTSRDLKILTHYFNGIPAIDFIPFGVYDCDAKHHNGAKQLTTRGSFADGESPKDYNIAQKERRPYRIHNYQKTFLGQKTIFQPETASIFSNKKKLLLNKIQIQDRMHRQTYDKNPQMNGNGDESPVLLFCMYLWQINLQKKIFWTECVRNCHDVVFVVKYCISRPF